MTKPPLPSPLTKPAVKPRDAAGLVLLRRQGKALQVLLGKRRETARFAPGIFVFPGGRCDHADRLPSGFVEAPLVVQGRADGQTQRDPQAFARTALRELWEETGLLLAEPGLSRADVTGKVWQAYQHQRLCPAFGRLSLLARAITPADSPIRFHTRFFLADGAFCFKVGDGDGELSPIDWYPVQAALAFPLWDVTEFVLRRAIEAFDQPLQQPWRFTYRGERSLVYPKTTRGK